MVQTEEPGQKPRKAGSHCLFQGTKAEGLIQDVGEDSQMTTSDLKRWGQQDSAVSLIGRCKEGEIKNDMKSYCLGGRGQ
jgi:hypothetical protein